MTEKKPKTVESLLTNRIMDNSGQCFITEALSAIFMPKIEYAVVFPEIREHFSYQNEF